jgi:3-methylcrotonyl-CoA carboxylase alpha subunit
MIRKILIANRGEIAVRIGRACRELGIRSVAVYSDIDQHALHVRMADEAYPIGPAPVSDSYLAVGRILEVARRCRADAVHPGYGLLSENAQFARAVQEAGLIFIGPSPQAIHAMGNKAAAREKMQAAGVPVVPGFQGALDTDLELMSAGAEVGYPLLIKAAAGGGGKGMRVVRQASELLEMADAARREAMHAFAERRLILEKYVPHAHHVEFQVLGDQQGKLLHVFERECSVQRRHQKIIEESPSPLMDAELRRKMGAAAVSAAQAAGYSNAGTVEFIIDPDTRQFFFLEMNTRLQVEHPVTEAVVGIDLVQWQIRIAAGERIPFEQEDLSQRGHAIECRLYAEDPEHRFLPASGKILLFRSPRGPGVRVDSGVTSGDEISVHYDPLIAKIIVYAADRQAAIRKMNSCLQETVLLGLTSNLRFLRDVLEHPDYQQGNVHTTWVEEKFSDWEQPQCGVEPVVLIAAAFSEKRTPPTPAQGRGKRGAYSPWHLNSGFRLSSTGKAEPSKRGGEIE